MSNGHDSEVGNFFKNSTSGYRLCIYNTLQHMIVVVTSKVEMELTNLKNLKKRNYKILKQVSI